jgi:histone arginine demethylase JMJD6
MNTTGTIEVQRRGNLPHKSFVAEHLARSRPVILTDAISHWRALKQWTPKFFAERYGDVTVTIDDRSYAMADFIDQVLHSEQGGPAPYLRNHLIEKNLPELLLDIMPLPQCTRPNWFESSLFPSKQSCTFLELYIGGRGASFPTLHYDGWHTHAFLMQCYGVKELLFFPPEQAHLVYPGREGAQNVSQLDDIEHPDLTKFPLLAQATPIRCELHPGETLFVPGGWWHTARMLSPSITVSANTANSVNWKQLMPEFCAYRGSQKSRLFNQALRLHLKILGMLAPLLDRIC